MELQTQQFNFDSFTQHQRDEITRLSSLDPYVLVAPGRRLWGAGLASHTY